MSRIYNAFDSAAAHQPTYQTSILSQQSEKLDNIKTASDLTNSKLDSLSGAVNNNLGDAQVKLQTYVYGYDSPNGLARPLAVTSNGELKVSNDVLEVSAETVNLNTDTLETKIQTTNDKIDGLSGAGNNNIGEGQTKLQTYLYGRDVGNGLFRPLVCDSDAHLQVDVLSTALPTGGATEATLAAAKNALFTNPAGTGNTLGENASAINSNIITTNSKIDTTNSKLTTIDTSATAIDIAIGGLRNDLTQNGLGGGNKAGVMLEAQNTNLIAISNKMVGGQTTSGMATAANQQVVDLTLQGIDTVLGDTQTIHSATNTKLDTIDTVLDASLVKQTNIETLITTLDAVQDNALTKLTEIDTAIDTIDSVLDNSLVKQTNIETLITSTNSKIDTLDAVQDNALTKLTEIDTAIDTIDSVLDASLVKQTNIETLITSTNSKIDTLDAVQDNALTKLTEIDTAIDTIDTVLDASLVKQTNIETLITTLDGVQDNALTKLTNIETAVQLIDDVVKAEDTAHSGADKGIMNLSVRKDTATSLAGSDADYCPLITGSAGHLHINDSLRHRVKDVAWMSNEAISATSYGSTILDTEGFQNICIYGEMNSGSVSGNSLMIEGSNASSGTYYGLGYLTNTTYGGVGGRTQFLDHSTSNGFGGRIYPRYLKIFNKTSGTINATLRATLAGFNTYI